MSENKFNEDNLVHDNNDNLNFDENFDENLDEDLDEDEDEDEQWEIHPDDLAILNKMKYKTIDFDSYESEKKDNKNTNKNKISQKKNIYVFIRI